ncbi:MAG: hypothetical protein A2672_01320 [Candidatus Wildermuthbacteria bacterium RIFCSPHIGHO2_01_FULL_49_22b]|uniref:Inositolphosphotransferase Aur1/Ipt1 domain-containing protein n=1 Tax=Candidatus Wildermuthbacteria bacterium RIFCSPHIGHO2_01_FULL_49_22b TaxID=1802448 RepID=A0A1G2R0R5_9BACT|nr:MAG: hypothetical protein A2672_01320 [Candidatus Wildermuthbacteria bacterium RIFCSPHIGHO2_01_FULL_49_22b]
MEKIREKLRKPEAVVWLAIFFLGVAYLLLSFFNKGGEGDAFSYYLRLNTQGVRSFLFWLALVGYGAGSVRLAVFLFAAGMRGENPLAFFSKERVEKARHYFSRLGKDLLFLVAPLIIGFYVMSLAIGQLNLFNASNLKDELLLQWDFFLTGIYPSLSLGLGAWPGWFVKLVEVSFLYLGMALLAFAFYAFFWRRNIFREAVAAFFAGIMILFLGWTLFPAMSPHDRFLDNVYGLSVPPLVQEYVNDYRPQEEIRSFLSYIRERKEGLSYLPTTTMPSAHVAWATLLAYYAWRAHRWLGLAVLPFALLSMLGTVLFAQHYFVDIPMGMLVNAGSILLVKRLTKKS